jgi:Uma2 family endonuclease
MKATAHKMTYDEYCLLPEDRNQYELFDGELVMTPSPTRNHQKIAGRLYARLLDHVEKNGLGEAYIAPLDAIFDPYTVLQPDILFVSKERQAEVEKERIEGVPDLVVEVLSPSTFHKDLRRKMAVYSRFGVQEYWVVDPEMKAIELYCQGKEGLELARRFSAAETFESRLLAGFRVAVGSIF